MTLLMLCLFGFCMWALGVISGVGLMLDKNNLGSAELIHLETLRTEGK